MGTATTRATTVRVDEQLKTEATRILDSIGLSFNSYLNLALKQLVNQRRVPFELVCGCDVPNSETRLAMLRAEAMEAGLIPDDAVTFDSAEDAIAYLEAL